MTGLYQEGYEQGEWDTENRLQDEMTEMAASVKALEHIAQAMVEHFGDLRTTIHHVRALTPRDVDELKRITRDIRTPTPSGFWQQSRR